MKSLYFPNKMAEYQMWAHQGQEKKKSLPMYRGLNPKQYVFSQWKPSCIGGIIISEGNKILKETTESHVLGVFLATESAL